MNKSRNSDFVSSFALIPLPLIHFKEIVDDLLRRDRLLLDLANDFELLGLEDDKSGEETETFENDELTELKLSVGKNGCGRDSLDLTLRLRSKEDSAGLNEPTTYRWKDSMNY